MSDSPLNNLILANAGDKAAYHKLLGWLLEHTKKQIQWGIKQYKNFPRECVDDICQDVLITFHQTHQTFDTSRSLVPWVNSIIKFKTIDFLRKKDFRVQMAGIDVDLFQEIWAITEAEEQFEPQELSKLFEKLNPKEKEILTLAKVEGCSIREIAQKLNLSDSNVKVQIHRALKKLKSFS